MTRKYAMAYTEVLEILNYLSKEEYSKIPEEKINYYKKYMDKDYYYKIDPTLDLSKQKISTEANAILVCLFRDYFATERQKEVLKRLLIQNQLKDEDEKQKKNEHSKLFQHKSSNIEKVNKDNVSIIKYKQSILSKLLNNIKKFFYR